MQYKAESPEDYISQLPEERRKVISGIRQQILENLPEGFEEQMSYGMLGYVVPHSIYPKGYHVKPELPLPFINLASQKNFIALYHSGLYADPALLEWFTLEYPKHCKRKLDMGKSCVRFRSMDDIPYKLIAELTGKMTIQEWINLYEKNTKK
ncbi:DUF1801 domain-containing protein [Maribacter cobaltidurans]|uniref:YdhG-like domain-containing protein n=1 Tax=Maribacter cobaltidurans TaxID=1178778 RepID=A0A223V452_9FLAO|nr:DUF1801 domain-containing protein [Maribacter cobaltidurans]ASV29778.1 hypothetical protein CJ263_05845 [Maribacter cobaltidurans]GGD92624.1 hypothetical protein GCM10011412_33230 [Maribacter cobaltidurans]